ncbi:MAG: hypothetical protein R6U96_13105 [Promethearchaeia archaeon]
MIKYKIKFYDNLKRNFVNKNSSKIEEKNILFYIHDALYDMVDTGDFIKILVKDDKRAEEREGGTANPDLGEAIYTLVKARGHWMNKEKIKKCKNYFEKLLEK